MYGKALGPGQRRARGRKARGGSLRQRYSGHPAPERGRRERAGEARGTRRGEHVVRPRHVVAEGRTGVAANEQAARLAHQAAQRLGLLAHQLEVLRRDRVGEPDRTVRVPRADRRERRVGHGVEGIRHALDHVEHPVQDRLLGGDHAHEAVFAVLGLGHEVECHELRVGALARHHHELARSGQAVDPDHARNLALGLRHVAVAGPDDHVGRPDRLRAVRERRDRLGAAHGVHLVHAAERARGKHGGVGARGAHRELVHARYAGRDRAHDHRGGVSRPAARNVRCGAAPGHLPHPDGLSLRELHRSCR